MKNLFFEKKFEVFSLLLIASSSVSLYYNIYFTLQLVASFLLLISLWLYPKTLFWMMLCAIPFSTEFSFNDTLGTDFPDEFFMLAVTGISFFILLFNTNQQAKMVWKNSLFFLLFFQFFWCSVSCFHSEVPLLSIKFLVAKIWYIIPFVILPSYILMNENSFKHLAYCIIIPSLIVIFYVLFQHSYYQFSFVTITDCVKPFFRNHVSYAAWLSFPFSIIIGMLIYYRPIISKPIFFILFIVFLAAVFFSYTRGTWVSILFSLVALYFFTKKLIRQAFIFSFLLLSIVITFFTINDNYLLLKPDFAKTVFHKEFSEHLNATYTLKDISASERIYRWIAGAKMSVEHPIVGFGPSSFYTFYKKYTDERFITYVSKNPEKSTVHNYFLLTTVEQGFVGLLLLIVLLFVFYQKCEYLYHHISSRFYKTVLAILCLIMTNIIVVNFFSDMIETDKVGTIYFLCFGILIWIEGKFDKNENREFLHEKRLIKEKANYELI